MRIIEVSAAVIFRGGEFLLCQRPMTKARGEQWEFPGGKREEGETAEQCLIRECREELGVTLCVDSPLMEFVHEYSDIAIRLSVFKTHIAEGRLAALEHTALRWVSPGEGSAYSLCGADSIIMERLQK